MAQPNLSSMIDLLFPRYVDLFLSFYPHQVSQQEIETVVKTQEEVIRQVNEIR